MTDKKKANKFLRRKYKGQGHTDLRKRIVTEFGDLLDLIEEHVRMLSWCASKNKKPSLLRFNNWCKNAIRFQKERGVSAVDVDALRRATKERIKKFE